MRISSKNVTQNGVPYIKTVDVYFGRNIDENGEKNGLKYMQITMMVPKIKDSSKLLDELKKDKIVTETYYIVFKNFKFITGTLTEEIINV